MNDVVVRKYYEALDERNFEAAREMLADDLVFQGPFDRFDNAADYSKTIQYLWGMVDRVDIQHVSSSGEDVVVLYDMVTSTPAGTQLICEWCGVRDGKISRIRVVFDTAPFAFLHGSG